MDTRKGSQRSPDDPDGASAGAELEITEEDIDETLKETFPASDPPSWTLGTTRQQDEQQERDKDS